jgi:DNA-binding winged helix-turn-helix (wHTH) protein
MQQQVRGLVMSIPFWVSTDAPYCRPDESVRDAMRKMNRWDCELLPVCDDDRILLGSISMRAVCLHANASGKRLSGMRVAEALEAETTACITDDRAPEVMRRMSEARQWCLPMVDHNHALIGMVRFRTLQRAAEGGANVIRLDTADDFDEMPLLSEVGFGGWRVSKASKELRSPAGDRRHLTRAEFRLLVVLAERAGSVLRRDVLMHDVCNREWDPSDRYIDVLVGNLRKKFGERASTARVILTIKNEGYLFTLQVQSPSGRSATASAQRKRRTEPLALAQRVAKQGELAEDQLLPPTLDDVDGLYQEQGETAAQTFCIERRIIASICMNCSRLFRVVDSQGTSGGLSHGWCSTNCARIGSATASAG